MTACRLKAAALGILLATAFETVPARAQAEFDAQRDVQFARTDTGNDGALDAAEYRGEFQARLDERLAELLAAPDSQTRVRFDALDTDKDGRIEYVNPAFSRMTGYSSGESQRPF